MLKVAALVFIVSLVSSRRLQEEEKPKRDYRPSKWLSNSVMDIWYGNKSVIEIVSRDLNQVVDKIALRKPRSVKSENKWEKYLKYTNAEDQKKFIRRR